MGYCVACDKHTNNKCINCAAYWCGDCCHSCPRCGEKTIISGEERAKKDKEWKERFGKIMKEQEEQIKQLERLNKDIERDRDIEIDIKAIPRRREIRLSETHEMQRKCSHRRIDNSTDPATGLRIRYCLDCGRFFD